MLRSSYVLPMLVGLLVPGEAAWADKPGPPMSFTVASTDGRFIFVMISPETLEKELTHGNERRKAKAKAIRMQYPSSGLYRNGGSKKPLWTVDWYHPQVAVASDGVHLVRIHPWPRRSGDKEEPVTEKDLDQEGLAFFAKGKLVRKWSVRELGVRRKGLTTSVTMFFWTKRWSLDDERHEFEVTTADGRRLRFDLRTGEKVR